MEISVDQFKELKVDDKLVVLFENLNTVRLQQSHTASQQRFDRKIMYSSIAVGASCLAYLFMLVKGGS